VKVDNVTVLILYSFSTGQLYCKLLEPVSSCLQHFTFIYQEMSNCYIMTILLQLQLISAHCYIIHWIL